MSLYFFRVNYTDFFGRTRRCLKSDLEFFKKRDHRIEKELGPSPSDYKKSTSPTKQQFIKEGQNFEKNAELISSDMRREELRLKWEEEERKLAERTDIHYEDIRFDGELINIFSYNIFSVKLFCSLYAKFLNLLNL